MKLRTAKMLVRILGALVIVLAVVYRITYKTLPMIGMIIAIVALAVIMAVFVKCPHCGAHFYRLSDSALRAGRCPYCGEEIDI